MSEALVPDNPQTFSTVSLPQPDILYGYSLKPGGLSFFNEHQILAMESIHPHVKQYAMATGGGAGFPFLAVQFKAATGGSEAGNLWTATNECAGAAAACLNAVLHLNESFKKHSANGSGGNDGSGGSELPEAVENIAFAIAIDNRTALVYGAWMTEPGTPGATYCMQLIDEFVLSRPHEFVSFSQCVRNILNWGKGARRVSICNALDKIIDGEGATSEEDEMDFRAGDQSSLISV
ncbi:hypothetical protein SCUCBS95973_008952 [Sporothrix curviconia]|uniref:DUF7924 domain-containing protein n=1 Tax=Sporothrix curviconia TaxID=1260050 RepID=A0ABP0CSC3_9PEZI